tara:strand:- start:268 stop:576 length:309 start_codon:yes stop_codon:yes gene_type:complete
VFGSALFDCPNMLGRVLSALHPSKYTLGEAELLRMLGVDAGRELDWDDWPDAEELHEIRNPKASVAWSEELYSTQTINLAMWRLLDAFGLTYGHHGRMVYCA